MTTPDTLHVLTPAQPEPCRDTMTCPCQACVHARAARADNVTPIRQPWEPRPARREAA